MGTASCSQLSPCHVTSLALSEYGNIVVFCKQESNRALCRYSINGQLLSKDVKLKEDVADILISGEYLVTGGTNGKLEIRQLHRFEIWGFFLLFCVYYTPLYKNPLRYMADDTIPIRSFQQTFELLGIVSMIFVRYSEVNGN